MKKHSNKKSSLKRNTKIAIAATMLSIPMIYSPATLFAQETQTRESPTKLRESPTKGKSSTENIHLYLKYSEVFPKHSEKFSIVGLDNRHTIYKNKNGEYFFIDPNTGDMKFLSADIFLKYELRSSAAKGQAIKMLKYEYKDHKDWNAVSLLGVDSKGNVVQQNSRGEKFYLDPFTGDMVFVK